MTENTKSRVNWKLETVTGVCEVHGAWECETISFAARGTTCPKCSRERADRAEAESQEAQRKAMIASRIASASIPKRFASKMLTNYTPCPKSKKIFDACTRYSQKLDQIQENGTSLIFCGKPGAGKTHIAIGIIQEAIRKGVSSRYVTVVEMVREVKSTYNRKSEKTESQVIKYYSSVAMLVIDEVGMQIGSDTEKLIISEIIDNRYSDVKPTIMISNLGIAELKEYLGERIFDRMKEGGGAVLNFDWESKRGSI